LAKQPNAGVAQIRHGSSEPGKGSLIPCLLHRRRDAANAQNSLPARLIVWQAAAAPGFGFHIEVKAHFRLDVPV
jgi:hypothetical protein